MHSFLHFSMLICCLLQCGSCQNSRITCPSVFYKEGESSIELTIQNSTFAVCAAGPNSVTCRWYPQTGTSAIICIQSVTNCETDVTSRGCRCTGQSGQEYRYSLTFSMIPNQEKGNINCSLDCAVPGSGPKATVDSDSTCDNIAFVGKCDENPCENGGQCMVDSNNNVFCDCENTYYYGGSRCQDRTPEFWVLIVLVSIILGVVALICAAIIIFTKVEIDITIVIHLENQREMEEFKQRWDEICDFIHEEYKRCCCCFCCPPFVVCGCCPLGVKEEYIGDYVIQIRLTTKLIRFFCVRKIPPKVEKYAKKKIIQYKKGRQPQNIEATLRRLREDAKEVLQKIHGEKTVSIDTVLNNDKISVEVYSEDTTKLYEAVAEMISAYSGLMLVAEIEDVRVAEDVSCPPDYPGAIPLGSAPRAVKRDKDMRIIRFRQEGRPETQEEIRAALGQLEKLAKDVPKKIHAEGTVSINPVERNEEIFVEVKSKNHTQLYQAVAEMILPFSDLELWSPANLGAAAGGNASRSLKPNGNSERATNGSNIVTPL